MKKSVHTLPLTLKIANNLSLPIRQAHPWIQLGNTIGACTSAALYHPVQITVSQRVATPLIDRTPPTPVRKRVACDDFEGRLQDITWSSSAARGFLPAYKYGDIPRIETRHRLTTPLWTET